MTASSTSRARFLTRLLQGAAVAGALALGVMGLSGQSIAATAANTVIQNQATVTYTDENTNAYSAQSNVASIKVKQIYSATIATDKTAVGAPGQLIYFQHTLSNNGNGTDTYYVAAMQHDGANTDADAGTSGTTADSGNFGILRAYYDVNANGQVDPGEALLYDGQAVLEKEADTAVNREAANQTLFDTTLLAGLGTITVDGGSAASIVIETRLPSGASGNTYGLKLMVESKEGTASLVNDSVSDLTAALGLDVDDDTNDDVATITSDAVLNVRKSAVVTQPTSKGDSGTITYNIEVSNTGLADATNVVLWDGVPSDATLSTTPNMAQSGFGANAGDVGLYYHKFQTGETEASLEDGDADNLQNDNVTQATGLPAGFGTLDNDVANDDSNEALTGGAVDINNDGDKTDAFWVSGTDFRTVVVGYDAILPANTTVSFSYDVKFAGTLAAGTVIKNIANVCADTDSTPGIDTCTPSNEVPVTTPPFPALELSDTGDTATGDNYIDDGTAGELSTANFTDYDRDHTSETEVTAWASTAFNGTDQRYGAAAPDNATGLVVGEISDIQYAGNQAAGSTVEFPLHLVNFGNVEDVFELEAVNNAVEAKVQTYITTLGLTPATLTLDDTTLINFQNGTGGSQPIFSFWDATGNTGLLDSNGDGIIDSGPIAAGATKTIMIKLKLPADYSGNKLHTAQINATSAESVTQGSAIVDSAYLLVGRITTPGGDLKNGTNYTGGTDHAVGAVPNTFRDDASDDAVTVKTGNPGATVQFDLLIKNTGGAPDAFQLSAGADFGNAATDALGAIHSGWSVVFKDLGLGDGTTGSGANGTCASATAPATITSTPAIPVDKSWHICAEVTISSTATQALADLPAYDWDNADNNNVRETTGGTEDPTDFNADTDGDYPIFFRIVSQTSGSVDVKLDAVDVNAVEDVSCVPNNANQLQPGGSVDYPHEIKNTGNTSESFVLGGANSNTALGFSNIVLITADNTSKDGSTPLTLGWSLLLAGDAVKVIDADGTTVVWKIIADLDGIGAGTVVGVTLDPGQKLPTTIRVFAPSSAANATVDVATLSGNHNYTADVAGATVSCSDTSTIILGQVRLTKTVSPDTACDGTPDEALATTKGAVIEPNQCAVWQIVATNEGDATVSNVIIYDAAPSFTTYVAGKMASCAGDATLDTTGSGCTTTDIVTNKDHTDADDIAATDGGGVAHVDGHFAKASGGNVTFYVGTGATQTTGGALAPGASITVRFTTQVD